MPNPSSKMPEPPAARNESFAEFRDPNDPALDRLVQAVDRAYNRPWLMMWRSFLQGVMTAIGAMVGTIAIIVIIGYAFSTLGGLELMRPAVEKLQNMLLTGLDKQLQGVDQIVVSPTPSNLDEQMRRQLNTNSTPASTTPAP